MNIIGLDALVFGVDDVAATTQYLTDFGLTPVGVSAAGGRFEALDGTALVIARKDDPALPPPMDTATQLRKIVFGVRDEAGCLRAIEEREIVRSEGPSVRRDLGKQAMDSFDVSI